MSDVFTTEPDPNPYSTIIPGVLCKTPVDPSLVPACSQPGQTITEAANSKHDGAWWANATKTMDFSHPDRIDPAKFNALLAQDTPKP